MFSIKQPMAKQTPRRRTGAAGMTLVEILVATTVFVVVAAVAMILYTSLSRSYKLGDNATEVQQNTRIAFDQLLTDLRMLGFNYNPDGATRADEQVEGAWETALSFRGDFDFDDPAMSLAPELLLAAGGSPFNIVSVGNDEIVTYALSKPDGTGGQNLVFRADVVPAVRDGNTEDVTISNLALIQSDPPYTLYRITVNPNSTSVTRTPVADNIYSLQFRYFDSGDNLMGSTTPADPSDDIGGSDTIPVVELRSTIRRIEASITGMTPDPDLRYTDPNDPITGTRNHRKFTLAQDVYPRNLGYVGRPDIDNVPPGQPANVVASPGHCGAMVVKWDPPAPTDLVTRWTVLSGQTATALGSPVAAASAPGYVEGLTDGVGYYFRVRAEDSSGNASMLSNLATPQPATVSNLTTPTAPAFLTASGDAGGQVAPLESSIQVEWGNVSTNVETVACDPQPTRNRDLAGYRLHRSTDPTFTPGPTTVYMDETQLAAGSTTVPDNAVVNCRTYYYNVEAVDKCDKASAVQATHADGEATTQYVPVAPGGLQAQPAGTDTVQVDWARISDNTNSPPDQILVDTYRVYRLELTAGLTPSQAASNDWSVAPYVDVPVSDINAPSYVDTMAYTLSPGMSYYYRVSGLTDCPSPSDEGALSDPVEAAACTFSGSAVLDPADGSSVSGAVSVQLSVSGADTYTGWITIVDPLGAVVVSEGTPANPVVVPISFSWDTAALPPGDYRIIANVTDGSGCVYSGSHTVSLTGTATCCIAPLSPVLGPTTGKLSTRYSDLLISVVNLCGQDLEVTRQDLTWTDYTGNSANLNDICWDVAPSTPPEDCIPEFTFNPPASPPVSQSFATPFPLLATRDDLNPLILGFKWDAQMLTGQGTDDIGETINLQMFYRASGATSDSECHFQVQTNPLDVVGVEP